MYLKQIEINGFKSFAEKTTLTFLPPKGGVQSLTAIVGPNGSGKSNVSDAIRWVMGEQSMKQLRGKKSEDIIFSGSEGKGKMGMASVMMTLDNADGRADVDFDELVIGRRIYRSGDSDYVINGKAVRLLDLQLLLAKAQFGQGSYAVIGQGMIDRLLLQSGEERKAFFDEASGIKEFQIKRHQAFLRLRRTYEHLDQAELLLNEISPRLKTLSRQVKKLEQRKELERALSEKQDQYYVTMWRHHDDQMKQLQQSIFDLGDQLKEKQHHLQTIQEELAQLASEHTRQEAFAELQREYQDIVERKNELERERAVLQGKMQTEYAKTGNHQLSWLESKVSELQHEAKQLTNDMEGLDIDLADKRKLVDTIKGAHDQAHVSRTALKSEISTLEAELLRIRSEQSAFHITGFHAVQSILEARHRLGNVRGVVAQLGKVKEQYHMSLDVAAGGKLASVVVDSEDDARACVEYLRSNRLGVATFLPMNKITSRAVPAFVYDVLRERGVVGLAQDLVDFEDTYANIFSFVFGSTVVVEDFDTAKRVGIGRVRMVTLDGDLFETTGAVKGGHRKMRQHGISFAGTSGVAFSAKRADECEQDIQEKMEQLDTFDANMEQLFGQLGEAQTKLQQIENKRELLQEQKMKIVGQLGSMEQELAMATMSPEQYGKALESIADQKEAIDKHIAEIVVELQDAGSKIAQFNEQQEEKKQRVFALQETMQAEQIAVNGLVEQKNEKQVALAKVETKQEDLQHELYQERHTSIQLIIDRGVESVPIELIEHVQAEVQKMKYKLSLIGGIDEEVVKEYEETRERHTGLTSQMDDLKKAHKDLTALIDELDTVMKKRRGKAFKQIRKEFGRYFSILFNGGKADLVEVYGYEDSDDLSEGEQSDESLEQESDTSSKRRKKILKGVDITACPPGKKIKHLQALSGGERTMTSIALMCAILKTNPSPFVVLDEVEAALDEANTLRVVNILKELAGASQFVIITHNRVTMHAADALYGVTMGNNGISKLISVKMEDV